MSQAKALIVSWLACQSRVNLVAILVLKQQELDDESSNRYHGSLKRPAWSQNKAEVHAGQVKTGALCSSPPLSSTRVNHLASLNSAHSGLNAHGDTPTILTDYHNDVYGTNQQQKENTHVAKSAQPEYLLRNVNTDGRVSPQMAIR